MNIAYNLLKTFAFSCLIVGMSFGISMKAEAQFFAGIKKKACSFQFLRTLNGKFSKRARALREVDVFDKKFNAAMAYKLIDDVPKDQRQYMFKQMAELADNSQYVNENITDLINMGLRKNSIQRKEIIQLTEQSFGDTRFFFGANSKDIHYQVNVSKSKLDLIEEILTKNQLPDYYHTEYNKVLLSNGLDANELEIISKKLQKLPLHKEGIKRLDDYLSFTNTYFKKGRVKAIKDVDSLFNKSNFSTSKYVKKFNKQVKALDDYELKMYNKIIKKMRNENGGALNGKLIQRAKTAAKSKRLIKQSLKNSCFSKNKNRLSLKDKSLVNKRTTAFKKFNMFVTLPLVATSYTLATWDDEKDANWFANLGFELSMAVLYTVFGSKYSANSSQTFAKNWVMIQTFTAVADAPNSIFYDMFPGNDGKRAEAEFEKLKLSPDYDKRIAGLTKYLQDNNLFEEMKTKFGKILHVETGYSISEADLEKLRPEDLDDPEIREQMIDLITEKIYDDESGELVVTGNKAVDRYSYYRGFKLLSVTKDLALGMLIYRTMCTAVNPRVGMAKAMGLIMANRLVIVPMEYKARQWAISQ
ncbi:MAG: hypothetical protein ACI9QD_001085 [Thermoproteota archaeon]|jgi:hypothetical protein